MTPFGDIDLDRKFVAWRQQASIWTNVNSSLVSFWGTHFIAILQRVSIMYNVFENYRHISQGAHYQMCLS